MISRSAFFLLVAAAAAAPAGRAADAELAGCLRALRAEAPKHGIGRAAFDAFTKSVRYDPKRALPDEAQPEFTWAIWEYLGVLVDDQRIEDGRRLLQEQASALQTIEQRYGVDGPTVVAIFGVETNFGAYKSRYPVVETFINRACGFPGARPTFKQEQKAHLFQALRMLQAGEVREDQFLGSRAGAFGMTQFMPVTYAKDKADVDGDGKADIINSVPDSLGATAHFLVRNGWMRGRPWAIAVELPAGFDATLAASGGEHARLERRTLAARKVKSVGQWVRLGVKLVDDRVTAERGAAAKPAVIDALPATLLLPEGVEGPAFLVTGNYVAFWRYNNSDAYAFAIGVLSDALRSEPRKLAWANNEVGLSRNQVGELQSLLIKRGHEGLKADGVPGAATREAVRSEQQQLGWPDTGQISLRLLETLRASTP